MFVRIPSDVPVDRPSVKAMRVACGSQISVPFKPYVYRGCGYDLLEGPPPEPKPKRKPAKKRKRRRPKPPPVRYYRPYIPPAPYPGAEAAPWNRPEPEPPTVSRNLRPSPGWEPMTGADIDDLLEDM